MLFWCQINRIILDFHWADYEFVLKIGVCTVPVPEIL